MSQRKFFYPWPQSRIEHEHGYVQVSQDYLEHGPKTKVNKIWALAKKNPVRVLTFKTEAEANKYDQKRTQA